MLPPLDGERPAEHGADSLGHPDRLGLSGNVLADEDELVAAEPRHRVTPAKRAAKPGREGSEQRIAGLVAKAVVDPLEVVEVAEQDRQRGR